MPLELQTLLLRVLEDNKVVHLGGQKTISVNVRILAATNQDLLLATEHGTFRRDLYYRLSVIKVQMPPLRDRQEDFGLLVDYHFKNAFGSVGRPVPKLDRDVIQTLQKYA